MPPTSVGSMPVRPVLRSIPIGPRVRSRAALSFSIPRFAESADVRGYLSGVVSCLAFTSSSRRRCSAFSSSSKRLVTSAISSFKAVVRLCATMLSNATKKEPRPLAIGRLLGAEVGSMNNNKDTSESNMATSASMNLRANAVVRIGINRSKASGVTPKLCANWLRSSMYLDNTP